MSQINDALKRAKKSQKSQPPNLPPGAAPLPPVEPQSGGGMGWLLLVVLLVAVGCFFIGLAIVTHKPAQIPPPPPAPVAVVAPVTPKPSPPPETNVVVATPPKPVPSALRLQGILMGSGKPQAIVNGQAVYVGDSVNGFRVQTIFQHQVLFLAPDGTQKMLALGK